MFNRAATMIGSLGLFVLGGVSGVARAVDWHDQTFPLEPARIGRIALAKPKGWSVSADDKAYRLMRLDGKVGIVLGIGQTPDPNGWDFDLNAGIQQVIGSLKPARVLSPPVSTRCLYREAVIEPEGQDPEKIAAVNVSKGDGTSWLMVAVLGTPSEEELAKLGGLRMLNTVVHSVTTVASSPPQALVGLWEDVVGRGYTNWNGRNMVGTATQGTANTYAFGKNRKYERRRDSFSIGQAIQGHAVYAESGTYETDGATIVFQPRSCTVEWYELSGVRTMRRQCEGDEFPQTASIEQASAGQELVLSGEGLREGSLSSCDNVRVRFTPVRLTR